MRQGTSFLTVAVLLLSTVGAAGADPAAWAALDHARQHAVLTPDRAEVQLHAALQRLAGIALDADQRSRLQDLTDWPVLALQPHPEGGSVQRARYPVARLARSLLRADALLQQRMHSAQAARLGAQAWLHGLRDDDVDATNWQAGLEPDGPQAVSGLIESLRHCAHSDARCADTLLRFAAQFDDTDVVAALPQASADMRVRFAAMADVAGRPVIQAALQVLPAATGISLQRHWGTADLSKSVPELKLLADPQRGADLAVVLAARLDADLLIQLQQRFANSRSLLEQQRLLLVLRLSGDPQAAIVAQSWQDSAVALPALQRSAASW